MVQYTLTLVMDDAILQSGSNDKLVIAKVVNGAVTNVFTGASPVPAVGFLQLQKSNVFSWADQYQVFGTAAFGKGVFVSSFCCSGPREKFFEQPLYDPSLKKTNFV